MNFSFEDYLKLSEEEKTQLKESIKSQLNTLKSFQDKELELKYSNETSNFKKEIIDLYNQYDIQILKYENFSIYNYEYIFKPSCDKDKGLIILLSDNELSEIEEYGLSELIKDSFEKFKNFNIEISLLKGKYSAYSDDIYPTKNIFTKPKISEIYFVSEFNHYNIPLQDNMFAYYLVYESQFLGNKKGLLQKKDNVFIVNNYIF